MAGGVGTSLGEPSSKVSDNVALSPSVIVSRSSVAVKVAAHTDVVRPKKITRNKSPAIRNEVGLRSRAGELLFHSDLSICPNSLVGCHLWRKRGFPSIR